jgi:NAD(P)-dependent dehydrogenase (short-subunit alcohol dehydrogenase family)
VSGRLQDRVAVVTGASSGIGRAVAELFAREGARLVLVAAPSDAEELEQAAAGLGAPMIAVDISDPDAAARVMDAALQHHGALDVLVNNAGFAFVEPALTTSVDRWDRLFAVNLRGTMLFSQAFATRLQERGQPGAIVNTASTNATAPEPQLAAYNASKAGVLSLTQTLALELAPLAIRVNAVLPGMTRTRQTQDLIDDPVFARHYLPMIPLGRIADPGDVAGAYLFLASDDARYVTGVGIPVDGGLTVGVRWPDVELHYDSTRWEQPGGTR